MISRLKGTLVAVEEQTALVETSGVCYEVMVPSGLAERLRSSDQLGQAIAFNTIYYIEAGDRKSNHYPRLVGFTDVVDREFFSLLTQVPGLGIKKALKSLVLPIREIASAIETRDAKTLSKLPGVGARLAEKIIAELNGKTARYALSKTEAPLAVSKKTSSPFQDEALMVLQQLQYSESEAETMLNRVLKENPRVKSAEDLITLVFQTEQARKAGE